MRRLQKRTFRVQGREPGGHVAPKDGPSTYRYGYWALGWPMRIPQHAESGPSAYAFDLYDPFIGRSKLSLTSSCQKTHRADLPRTLKAIRLSTNVSEKRQSGWTFRVPKSGPSAYRNRTLRVHFADLPRISTGPSAYSLIGSKRNMCF